MALRAPYLEAIQAVPGDTPGEKFRWIANLIKERASACTLEEIVESEKIPRPLVPLLQIEAAKILNKQKPEIQSNYEAIAEALKSEDLNIVNRALRVTSFFDGRNKNITNVEYFFNQLFPNVSLNTRLKILKTLARCLASKDPVLAERFFTAISSTYGMQQALILLPACSESFIYHRIIEHRLVLSRNIIKNLFRKNPDFVVRYLRLSKPKTDVYERDLHPVDIYDYSDFLVKLIKKRLEAFVELYEMHEAQPPAVTLSNKCAEAFLKNGKEYLQKKPQLYIRILPLKMIGASCMETIFPKLFPESVKDFDTEKFLSYLQYYPQDKKVSLLTKSYQQVYGQSLLDNYRNVTPKLLEILPVGERVKQARIKIQKEDDFLGKMYYEKSWRCYLSTKESLPEIKQEISRTSEPEYRITLLSQLIYSCKVNNDDQALAEVLRYIRDRHKNEIFLIRILETLLNLYDVPKLSEDHWAVLFDIIRLEHVRSERPPTHCTNMRLLEAAAHYQIIHNLPLDTVIGMIVDIKSMRYTRTWNILQNYPEYERRCLEACMNTVSQRFDSGKSKSEEDKAGILYDLVVSMYDFNSRHVKRTTKVEPMLVKNYPWLLKQVELIVSKNKDSHDYTIRQFKESFRENEKDLFDRFWDKQAVGEIIAGEAMSLLKKNPEIILQQCEDYLKWCRENWYRNDVRRFVAATRWYKDIPLKFVDQCVRRVTQEKCGVSLVLLALLLHGKTFASFVEPLVPVAKTIDIEQENARLNYSLISFIPRSTNLANPPVPLELVARMCEGDYLSITLRTLTNLARRTSLSEVTTFARTLSGKRVSVRKHGIRLIHLLAPRDQLHEFLLSQWRTEENHSIRQVLLEKVCDLYRGDPGPATWSLFSKTVSSFTSKDQEMMSSVIKMISSTHNENIVEFVKLLLKTIDNLAEAGVVDKSVVSCSNSLLKNIDASICCLLPEDFIGELLDRFLFHVEPDLSESAGNFVVDSLLCSEKIEFESRVRIFSSVFAKLVKKGWNVAHPNKSHFYPVNHGVHTLVNDLTHAVTSLDLGPRLIDSVLQTFLSLLTPQMAATSYLLLAFAKEQTTVKTPKEFGMKLGKKLPELLGIFSPLSVSFITRTLRCFLRQGIFKDYEVGNINLGVIEGLIEVGTTEATLVAVELLSPIKSIEYVERYDKLVKKLGECDHPAIKSILYDTINRTSYHETIGDE